MRSVEKSTRPEQIFLSLVILPHIQHFATGSWKAPLNILKGSEDGSALPFLSESCVHEAMQRPRMAIPCITMRTSWNVLWLLGLRVHFGGDFMHCSVLRRVVLVSGSFEHFECERIAASLALACLFCFLLVGG